MKTKFHFLLIGLVMALIALACGTLNVEIEEPAQPTTEDVLDITDTPDSLNETDSDNSSIRDDTQKEDYSDFWIQVEDYRTGLRFAIPCFWVANIPTPEQDPTGLGSFSVNNFTEDFITSLGPKRGETVWEIGGLKFDLGYHRLSEFNLPPTASLEELAFALVNPDTEHGIESTQQIEISGKQALRVNSWSTFGNGSFYLLPYVNDLYVLFGPGPGEAVDHLDLQAILQSMVLDPEQQVILPTHRPANPPAGMDAPCVSSLADSSQPDSDNTVSTPLTGTLACNQVTDTDPLMWIICNVQDSFISRNTQPLLGYMGEVFRIGYWQSQGVELTREQALNEIESSYIPPDTSRLTFTMDRNLFPPLFGMQPEQIFPPDSNIIEVVYSEGWGQGGQGAALLYFAEKPDGGYYFYGMVIAQAHFDK